MVWCIKLINKGTNMTVLSLFDGISGTRSALQLAGLNVSRYYSSEIDINAITIANNNFPGDNEYRLGDLTKLTDAKLHELPHIELMVGGSSCTDLSAAGLTKGLSTISGEEILTLESYIKLKEEGHVFFGQSYLFFEFVRIMSVVKPTYFLVENVKMSSKWLSVFEQTLGVTAILINSSLLVPQNRERYYFTNIPNVTQPEDTKPQLKDTLETDVLYNTMGTVEHNGVVYSLDKTIKPQIRNNIVNNISQIISCTKDFHTMKIGVTSGWSDNKIALTKTPTLRASNNATYILDNNNVFRRLTVVERERLQGLPDNYTAGVSDTARVKATGNGFTEPVIAHIFKGMK